MSINKTKEAIEGLTDDDVVARYGIGDDGTSDLYDFNELEIADLKSLAASHTRLLEAANGAQRALNTFKLMQRELGTTHIEPKSAISDLFHQQLTELQSAIAEAEK